MDSQPKTRQESKKDQRKKGHRDALGSGKGARQKEANLERGKERGIASSTSKTPSK